MDSPINNANFQGIKKREHERSREPSARLIAKARRPEQEATSECNERKNIRNIITQAI